MWLVVLVMLLSASGVLAVALWNPMGRKAERRRDAIDQEAHEAFMAGGHRAWREVYVRYGILEEK
jgi:hypothetical protein